MKLHYKTIKSQDLRFTRFPVDLNGTSLYTGKFYRKILTTALLKKTKRVKIQHSARKKQRNFPK